MTKPDRYLRAYAGRARPRRIKGVYGRILRTMLDKPLMLSDENRRAVMVMGPQGLEKLLGKSGYDALIEIGQTREYVVRNLEKGYRFKLLVFSRPSDLKVATWKGAIEVASKHYPHLKTVLRASLRQLKRKSFEDFERELGFSLATVQANGPSDPRFMTAERLLESKGTAADVRRFLFHVLNLNELFSGDGYTRTHDGRRGVREYLIANRKLESLNETYVLDLNVEIPG